ncbi:hypothetical protein LCGC14_2160260, partial [marine sediment metagenome]
IFRWRNWFNKYEAEDAHVTALRIKHVLQTLRWNLDALLEEIKND